MKQTRSLAADSFDFIRLRDRVSRFLPGWLIDRLNEPHPMRRAGGLSGFLQHIYKPPRSEAEAIVHRELLDAGHVVVRSGWPDFMVLSGPDDLFVVEVKGPGDQLRDNQIVVLELLARAGIDTYIRWPDYYQAIGGSTPWVER